MSELVCHRSYWLPIMVYVVLLHLFASLVRLHGVHSLKSQLLYKSKTEEKGGGEERGGGGEGGRGGRGGGEGEERGGMGREERMRREGKEK